MQKGFSESIQFVGYPRFPKLASPRARAFCSVLLCAEERMSFQVLDQCRCRREAEQGNLLLRLCDAETLYCQAVLFPNFSPFSLKIRHSGEFIGAFGLAAMTGAICILLARCVLASGIRNVKPFKII